jgi:hypothetical protein
MGLLQEPGKRREAPACIFHASNNGASPLEALARMSRDGVTHRSCLAVFR